jgi:hypothetical protein
MKALAAFSSLEALVTPALIVVLWALVRPSTVRDSDNRKLPVSMAPRAFVVLTYVFLFFLLIGALNFFPEIGVKMIGQSFVGGLFESGPNSWIGKLHQSSPQVAIFILGMLMTQRPVREMEQAFLVWAHSASHRHGDVELLSRHLRTCTFVPSEAERVRSIKSLEAFNIFLTDDRSQSIELASVNLWRKVSTLLRLIESWSAGENSVLSRAELKLLDEIKTAHERKTKLALTIVRLLNLISRGQGTGKTLTEVTELLAQVPHGDKSKVAEMEARIGGLMSEQRAEAERAPVRLSSQELQGHLEQIQGYFLIEYETLVQQVSDLAAKSVAFAGEQADRRLQALKSAGFPALGRIEPVRLDRVLATFLFVIVGGVAIFAILRYPFLRKSVDVSLMSDIEMKLLNQVWLLQFVTISAIMAFAALIAAIVGSNRAHARAECAPWLVYLGAGVLAVLVFFCVHSARLTFFGDEMQQARQLRAQVEQMRRESDPAAGIAQVAPERRRDSGASARRVAGEGQAARLSKGEWLYRMIPGALLPFSIVVVMCWLGRLPAWPGTEHLPDETWQRRVIERALDGLALVATLSVAYVASRYLRNWLGIQSFFGSRNRGLINWEFVGPVLALGFFIGTLVVRDIRKAAHAQIVDLEPARAAVQVPVLVGGKLAAT